jgi:hypothetical protein
MSTEAETFAKYHDEHGVYGGVSKEFHERAASFLRCQAERIVELEKKVGIWKGVADEDVGVLDERRERINTLEAKLALARKAAELAWRYGMIDGAHHKQWVIDQMLRTILGDEYDAWVREHNGNVQYDPWDRGIAP